MLDHGNVLSGAEIMEMAEGHSKIYQNAELVNVLKKIDRESYISFRLDHLFGISIKDVKEIINYTDDDY
ncbi:hypothetical protein SHI21_05630 [Bacteriovorax sp. PP10]|uniref:Uncharacterized protein n=1 Tax=Bacteriovorax antarcticus TaxID=3088717 RepID=A0ABU5VSU1_9BACT|nr:hypothetical protein [Bacteriovorax sp. PP10]MEA9355667.1 hypothetical protein [Bacteriovorax sp. PP10]